MQVKASAPGSLMLLGEYAVLHGKHAVVCAVDQRISVTISARADHRVSIQAPGYGTYLADLSQLSMQKPFHFVLGVLTPYVSKLKRGCHVDIQSTFSGEIGLGSSAAVTVATLAALLTWLNCRVSAHELLRRARQVVRQIQGQGSGADIAASIFGGVIGYQAQPLITEKFPHLYPITVMYSGYKTPTKDVIQQVQSQFAAHPSIYRSICASIGECALQGVQYLRKEDWKKFGEMMNIQQGMMEALGVCTPLLRGMVENLRQQHAMLGAKISGSGLGDCIIGLGEATSALANAANADDDFNTVSPRYIPVMMSREGVYCEKI